MNVRSSLAAVILLSAAAGMPVPAAADGSGRKEVATRLLPSDTPLVVFRILFRAGSQDDPAGQEGITALAAQTVAEGGTGEIPYDEVVRRLYPMAGRIDVQVDKEVTVFTGQVHRDHLEAFYRLFSGLLL